MKIIKPGNPDLLLKEKTFICADCGCEFIANRDEYQYGGMQYNISYWKCICPCCGKKVWTED